MNMLVLIFQGDLGYACDDLTRNLRVLLNYGWLNFPLAYTQVATFSVFTYFLVALFGRQYLIPREAELNQEVFPHLAVTYSNTAPFDQHTPDIYIPFFTLVEIVSYVGWIKVAQTLLNPFGEDEQDFQVNYIIDRNLQVSYLIVDEAEDALQMAADPYLEAGIAIPDELPAYEWHCPKNCASPPPIKRMEWTDLTKKTSTVDAAKTAFLRKRTSNVETIAKTTTAQDNPAFVGDDDDVVDDGDKAEVSIAMQKIAED